MKRIIGWAVALAVLALASGSAPHAGEKEFKYRSPEQIESAMKLLAKEHKNTAQLHQIGQTPGGWTVSVLQIGEGGERIPAVLVVANMEGNCPQASEAALELSRLLLTEWQAELETRCWYIVPLGNPDGHARYFHQPLGENFLNEKPVNADNDDAVDEDGPDDLNGDGYITTMRQVHPEGRWLPVEGNPLLMKRADAAKGEKGVYRLFSEGLDDDGDGRYNEDGPGGVNPGHNFPHNFEHYTSTDGLWAASEVESRAIMRFAFDHPEIALVLTFGRSNSLLTVPQNRKKAGLTGGKYKVPERYAERLGLEPDTELPLTEITDLFRDMWGNPDLTEERVLMILGAGAAVNPDKKDLPYWKEISERYNNFLKEAGLDGERLDPPGFCDGSIEEWAYYHYGVPSFSLDFWTVPVVKKKVDDADTTLSPEAIQKMSNEDFIQLGEEKIDELLVAGGISEHLSGVKVVEGLKSGKMTTKRIAAMLRRAEKDEDDGVDDAEKTLYAYNQDAFLPWQSFNHPTLGDVEIGGKVPYSDLMSPADEAEAVVSGMLPFVRDLVNLLPRISIEKIEFERKETDLWKLDVWVANGGFLPYPTHQGKRCRRPLPAVVSIAGDTIDLLEGRDRRILGLLGGSGGSQKVSWLVRAPEGDTISLEVSSPSAGGETLNVTLREGGDK
jgi:hypothetical protein